MLFPLLAQGFPPFVQDAIAVMRMEHEEHDKAMRELDTLTGGNTLPEDASGTWRSLYAGLAEFRRDLMQHVALENEILFKGPEGDENASAREVQQG